LRAAEVYDALADDRKEIAMRRIKHWQDAVNACLGAWLIAAPWVLGFQGVTIAALATAAIGILLFASCVGAMSEPAAWEEWMDVGLGVLLLISPVLLGFHAVDAAVQNALIVGGAVTVLALWVLAADDEFASAWQRLLG
jgi:hypothetical protein